MKVEPLHGDAARSAGELGEAMIRTNNRDKLSLAVDLRRPEGHELARRLLLKSDVLIENMRPGAMDRLGLDAEQATAINPRLVYLSISAFGRASAESRPGLDIAAQAESGMMSVTGEAGGEPLRVGFTVVDNATGYAAAAAVLAALVRRERSGQGAVIDISLLEVAVRLQGTSWTSMFASGVEPQRSGNGYPVAAPVADVIAVRDGRIVLSAYTPEHWSRLCAAIGRSELEVDPRFATNEARVNHRAELRAELTLALGDYEAPDAVRFLNARGIVAGVVRSYGDVIASDDARDLNLFPRTEPDQGPGYRYVSPPFSLRDVGAATSRSAPSLGADTHTVLLELGYLDRDVDRLVRIGVVGDARSGHRVRDR